MTVQLANKDQTATEKAVWLESAVFAIHFLDTLSASQMDFAVFSPHHGCISDLI